MQHLLDRPVRIHVSTTGAGAGIQQALWNVPGISKILVGATFPYENVGDHIGYTPDKFVTMQVAADMAIESYLQAAKRCKPEFSPLGLGLTASVASSREHRGEHRVYAIALSRFGAWGCEFVLDKATGTREGDGLQADQIAMRLIDLASTQGINTIATQLMSTSGKGQIIDATDLVRATLFERPVFTARGRREEIKSLGKKVLLMPGSFNPLHMGHLSSSTVDTLLQITATSPHKSPATVTDLLDRVVRIREHRDVLLLENHGLYIEKARLLPGVKLLVGVDSMLRMLDPRWGVETEPLLQEFANLGTTFEVSNRDGSPIYSDALVTVPEQYRHMFQEAPRHGFEHYSSTAVRKGDLPGLTPNP